MALQGDRPTAADLSQALQATADSRGSLGLLPEAAAVFDDVEQNAGMQKLWRNYQQSFGYTADIRHFMA